MSLVMSQSVTAVGVGIPASFLASGGTGPYTYAVLPGGAGGTINPTTGIYTAPATIQSDPSKDFDTIQATDSASATVTGRILIGTPLILFCEILQQEMGLSNGRVYLWDQKIMQPTDNDLYVAVSVPSCKAFANNTTTDGSGAGLAAIQTVNMLATCDIDIISRGPSARDRKEEIILALNSIYAQSQQEINGFYIGKIQPGTKFLNLSEIDGAAIPYRYKISVNLQYAVTKTKAVDYYQFPDSFEEFQAPEVTTEP